MSAERAPGTLPPPEAAPNASGGPGAPPTVDEIGLLRQALESMPVGFSMFGADDRLQLFNSRFRELWCLGPDVARRGATYADIVGASDMIEVVHPDGPSAPLQGDGVRRREWQTAEGTLIEVVVRRRADGSTVALHEDVTARRRAERRIAWLAGHDVLTGLANRSVLRETLERALAPQAPAGSAGTAVLCLDLDRFKAVNDELGHAAGDALLRNVAHRLRGCCRAGALVARLGGDEFAIVEAGLASERDALELGRRIVAALSVAYDLEGRTARIGASVGVCVAPADGRDVDTLLRRADLALYRGKTGGRGAAHRFEPWMEAAELRRAG